MRTVDEIRRGLLNGTISDNPVEITFEEACCFHQMDPEKMKKILEKDRSATFMGKPAMIVDVPSGNQITVPFTEADACWCQPFDGPKHPRCPMHGDGAENQLT